MGRPEDKQALIAFWAYFYEKPFENSGGISVDEYVTQKGGFLINMLNNVRLTQTNPSDDGFKRRGRPLVGRPK